MNLGDRIRQIRQNRSQTLKDVSAASGLSISYISDIEHGRSMPTLIALGAIAGAFGMDAPTLLQGVALLPDPFEVYVKSGMSLPDEKNAGSRYFEQARRSARSSCRAFAAAT